ncbi:MAG: ATP-dependent metallopeptidase FtsH/Yme1/Tma family protein, partial [Finegoldia magna]|nr:ATP-dependent metallopeptidase FtsH/Yme1/Tma family protein [Finegoldia magna]
MKENKQNKKKIIIYYLLAIVLYAVVAGLLFPTFSKTKEEEVPYNKFIEMLDKGEVKEVKILDT